MRCSGRSTFWGAQMSLVSILYTLHGKMEKKRKKENQEERRRGLRAVPNTGRGVASTRQTHQGGIQHHHARTPAGTLKVKKTAALRA
jgi:hypothetical protein